MKPINTVVLFLEVLVLSVFVFFFTTGCSNATQNNTYKNINAKQAFELIQDEDILILDVRTKGEYAKGHIKNSVLIPVQVLNTDYIKIKTYKKSKILIYCRSGSRSVTASKILLKKGFIHLYNMTGGIKDWSKNSYPIQTSP
ncbi:MAG: rhodanese-like domain-containing protein [Desulfobacula sp.]|nr:rhodanese-like domain-containing protein [Desulfobacula sp.]